VDGLECPTTFVWQRIGEKEKVPEIGLAACGGVRGATGAVGSDGIGASQDAEIAERSVKATGLGSGCRLSIFYLLGGWKDYSLTRTHVAASECPPERRGPRPASEEGKPVLTEAPRSQDRG